MNPPTEQLIRDYLNRVSVAARGRLSANDRRAFLARTREFIEQNTRAVGRTQTADVLKLLSELGDPQSLVNTERQRLAAGGTEPSTDTPAGSSLTDTPAGSSLAARARRLRAAPANVASLLRASAAVVAPGDAPIVPEPAEDNPLTGDFEEIARVRRPISSRWRPGEIVVPRPPGPRRPGLPRRPGPPGLPPEGDRPQPPAPAEPGASPQTDSAPQVRPEWPSLAARRPASESPEQAPGASRPTEPAATGPAATGPAATGPAANGPAANGSATNGSATYRSAAGRSSAPAPDTEPDNAAASDTAPSAGPGPDWATLSPTEADWTGSAAAGGNRTDPAAGPGSGTSASGPAPASLTNGAAAGPGATPAAAPGDRTPPRAEDRGPGGGRPPTTATAGAGPAAGPDSAGPDSAMSDSAGPGSATSGSGPGSAGAATAATPGPGSVSPAATGAAGATDGEDPRPVARNTLVGPPAAGADAGPGVPPRGGRVTWASGVRSRAMRMGPLRTAGARLSGARSGGLRDGQSGPAAGGEPDGPPAPGGDFLATASAAAGRTAQVAARWVRRHPLEATAVVLLGLGGLIYPPVWLAGALVATFSKAWSISDKWLGLVLPVFLVIVGIVVEVSLDGAHQDWTTYVRDAWVFASHLSRILALLGAIYLAWRTERGPRSSGVPPWQKARRLG